MLFRIIVEESESCGIVRLDFLLNYSSVIPTITAVLYRVNADFLCDVLLYGVWEVRPLVGRRLAPQLSLLLTFIGLVRYHLEVELGLEVGALAETHYRLIFITIINRVRASFQFKDKSESN